MIGLKRHEVGLLEPLVESQAVSKLQLIQARQSLLELEAQAQSLTTEHARDLAVQLPDTVLELAQLRQTMTAAQNQLQRTEVVAPTDGIVNRLLFSTVGAVVGPGEPIFEIVPASEDLRVEARVATQDIGFVTTGMRAALKVTAYDFTVHGTLLGTVSQVSAGTVPNEEDRTLPPAFIATIELDPESLRDWRARDLEIRPGMIVDAELQAGNTRILHYVIRPILRARDALGGGCSRVRRRQGGMWHE